MTSAERFVAALTFGNPDKVPLLPGGPRESTRARWVREGMPAEAGENMGTALHHVICNELGIDMAEPINDTGFFVDFRMKPLFEEKVLEHKNGHYVISDWMGNVVEISDQFDYTYIREAKDFVTRRWISFPVTDRESWLRMRERYDPMAPGRVPDDLPAVAKKMRSFTGVTQINISGPFWQLREWMGMEPLCIAFLDTPDLVHEMMDYWCDFVLAVLERVLPYAAPTAIHISEDMAYKAHPMISPAMTREFIQPTYEKWMAMFKKYGIRVINMDSDGYIEDLIPIWIDSGINVCEPIEVAAGNDIVHFRDQFGRNMAYNGGIDKRAIAKGGDIMRAEVMRVVPPLLREGGFIPGCDHGVPPDIGYRDFIEYTRLLAQLTGWL